MYKYKMILTIILFFSGSVYGQAYSERGVIDLIKRDLSVTTKTLTREVRAYHWFGSHLVDKKTKLNDPFFDKHFLELE